MSHRHPTHHPSQEHVRATVALLLSIAHPIRLQVLLALQRCGPLSVSEMQGTLRVEQSALSHQLRKLRDARLVLGERAGKRMIYRLMDEHVAHIVADALVHAAGSCDAKSER